MTRLTDKERAEALQIAEDVLEFGNDATVAPRYCLEKLARMVAEQDRELRTRSAADLSAEDVEALRYARELVDGDDNCGDEDCDSFQCRRVQRALAVLDRLLSQHGGG